MEDLKTVFESFSKNSKKLINVGSSFNRIVASKNPKSHFYSSSESTSFRVAAAVAQRNTGGNFLPKVYDKLLLSPGENTKQFIEKDNRNRNIKGTSSRALNIKEHEGN